MAQARSRDNWAHTSAVLAMLANCNRARGPAFAPADFDPHKQQAPRVADKEDLTFMKELFTGRSNA
jgi:hypothetical protein